jgi:hypothetical protein
MKLSLQTVVFALTCLTLFAQSDANKGQIAGTVFDPKTSVIPNAKISVRNTATGATREVTSGAEGQFRAVLLDPGIYDVSVTASGFAPAQYTGLTVNVGSGVNLPVTLQLGSTTQTIQVTAELTGVDLPAPTTIINTTAIENLPINGRRFTDFAALTPTVQIDPQRGSISFAGQRGINGNVMVDGADYNNPFFGGTRGGERSGFVPTIPQSSIAEFQAITTGYAAEYGRSTGGILNAVSKSGANAIHGEAFYQNRPQRASEENPIIPTIRVNLPTGVTVGETREKLQQFGGGVGGAIKKDKLFWYAAAERQLSELPRQIFFTPLAGRTATPQTQEAFNFYQSQQGPLSSTNDATATSGRLDYQMNSGSHFTARFNFGDANASNAITTGAPLPVVDNRALNGTGNEKDRTITGVADYTSILSPSMANDFRYSGTHEQRPRTSNSAIPNVVNTIGSFGARNFLPTVQDDTRHQLSDGISIIHATHSMKFGADYSYLTTFQKFGFNQFGGFTFGTTDIPTLLTAMSTAPGQNRFDNTTVRYAINIGNLLADYHMHQIAFFGQDVWKINSQFQINYGLRWEGQVNPTPVTNNTAVVQTVQAAVFPINGKYDPSKIPNNLNQWMPRFGFTFTPVRGSAKTVVRGHAGIFYAATPMIIFSTPSNNFRLPPGDLSLSYIPTATQPTVYQVFKQAGYDLNNSKLDALPIPSLDQLTNAFAALNGSAPNPFVNASFTGIANDFQNPRAFQTGLGLDQEVGHGWVFSAQLNYVNTVHLQRHRDYNLPVGTLRAADGRVIYNRTNRPLPQYGQITISESSARSMYRGATFSAKNNSLKYVQFGVQYTVAQSYSDDDNERSASGFNYDNTANLKAEYGYSNLDIRNNFSSYAVGSLPLGLQLSGTFAASSGQPIDPTAGSDVNTDGSTSDRAFQAVGVPFARNAFRNKGFKTVNIRLIKDIKLGEKARVQLSAEMFNLFNFKNVVIGPAANNTVNTTYGPGINADGTVAAARADALGPTFMRLKRPDGLFDANNTQIGTPFQAQFGVRLLF